MSRKDVSKLELISPDELCGEDFFDNWLEGDYESRAMQLQKLNVGESCIVDARPNSKSMYYQGIIERYQEVGLDIGKGNFEFGYRMPNQNGNLKLIIFRRHEQGR